MKTRPMIVSAALPPVTALISGISIRIAQISRRSCAHSTSPLAPISCITTSGGSSSRRRKSESVSLAVFTWLAPASVPLKKNAPSRPGAFVLTILPAIRVRVAAAAVERAVSVAPVALGVMVARVAQAAPAEVVEP